VALTNKFSQYYRNAGGAVGPPPAVTAAEAGIVALNFSDAPPGLYAVNDTGGWVRLNPPGVAPNVRGVAAGADQGSIQATFNNDAITVAAGDVVVYTYGGTAYIYTGSIGAPVAGAALADFTALGAAAQWATAAEISPAGAAPTVATKGINPATLRAELARMLGIPAATLQSVAGISAPTGAGATVSAGDASKAVLLTAAGTIDPKFITIKGTQFIGAVDVTGVPAGAATTAGAGDFVTATVAGAVNAGWGGAAGSTVKIGDMLMADGAGAWHIIEQALDMAAFVKLGATNAMLTAGTLSWVGAAPPAATVIVDGGANKATVQNLTIKTSVLAAGTF